MIARTLCFASIGKLSLRYNQLVWEPKEGEKRTMPVEDIGYIILETDKIEISGALLRYLAEQNVALVVCDQAHMPTAQLMPYAAHTTAAESMELQLAATEAVQGRIWRQICRRKILNQAKLMDRIGVEGGNKLRELADMVKNGDPTNCEAQAAKTYFQALGPEGFKRERDGAWPNAPLNYGYALLRAAVARAIVGSGLVCFRGVHHHNRYNAFALADDLMEPYRQFVDQYVLGKLRPFDVPFAELTHEMKARLMEALTCDVKMGEVHRPLMIAVSHTTASLVRYYKRESEELALPEIR